MPVPKNSRRFSRALGQKIRGLRKEYDMTQKDLADEIGVSMNQISKFEMGTNCPSVYRLITIARALETTIDEMVKDLRV